MFFFGKKKKEDEKPMQQEEKTEVDYDKMRKELAEKEEALEKASGKERISILNALGKGYHEINEIDKAIHFYEVSLSENRELGKAYTDLMKLYNIKRRTATEEKNDTEMKLYMDKIEELMKLSKDVMRGKA